jgi:ATP adenylyltransferase
MEEQRGVGDPDAFQRLWTPERLAYVRGEKTEGCPFCAVPGMSDEDGLVVRRGETAYAVLNLYPYNPGHLLLVPYRHVADYADLTADEVAELGALTQQGLAALRAAAGPQGFNVGLNLGNVAGAGIPQHLHQHVVPRWGGDTNFMPVVGHTRVLPQLLAQTRQTVAEAWPAK